MNAKQKPSRDFSPRLAAVVSSLAENRHRLCSELKRHGLSPQSYQTAHALMDGLNQHQFAVIVLDNSQQQDDQHTHDEQQFRQQLLSTPNRPPVIVTIKKLDIAKAVQALRSGAEEVLCLPFNSFQLSQQLKQLGLTL